MKNRRVPYTGKINKTVKQYWRFPKLESRLLLSYYIGELSFKDNKKREMTAKYGNTNCFYGCNAPDSLEHVKYCKKYDTQYESFYQDGTDKRFVEYLRALDIERWRKFQCPLVYQLGKQQRAQRRRDKKTNAPIGQGT